VLAPHEVRARQQIAYERFVQDIEIEARVALSMLRTAIVPAVRADAAADAAAALSARGIDAKRQLTHSLLEATDALEAALTAMPHASVARRGHSTPPPRCAPRCRQHESSPISSKLRIAQMALSDSGGIGGVASLRRGNDEWRERIILFFRIKTI
jgi:glutamine synthetase type III